jgi:trans-2,3-dihydro-3-hydroxyanthranilate isomerase
MDYHFEQVDVFTNERFAGNPLAVFTDGRGLTAQQMQLIAREMNLSETTFVVPSSRTDCVARYHIYTPGRELPFAGHPTIGTAYVLARSGRVPEGATSFSLEAKVGAVPLRVIGTAQTPEALFFTSPEVLFGPKYENRARLAEALNINEAELLAGAPLEQIGCPVLHLTVGVRTPEIVDRVVLNAPLLSRLLGEEETDGVYVFAPTEQPDRFYTRLLCHENTGIVEDPATGSAAAPLGAYLARYGFVTAQPETRIIVNQGVKMGRPSFIDVRVYREGPDIRRVEVGGSVVSVLHGVLSVEEGSTW